MILALLLFVGAAPTLRSGAPTWQAPRGTSADLGRVAEDTLRALSEMGGAPPEIVATLEFVTRVTKEDTAAGGDRLADPSFLSRCFVTERWVPDTSKWGERIRLTRYLVFEVEGRATADAAHGHALWALPDDERGLTATEAEAKKDTLLRYRYTRQDVAAGVYREGGAAAGRAAPLVWLTHEDHEQALLQGTVAVHVPGEAEDRLYNVHRNNGIPYDRAVTDTRAQRRYWYFRGIDAVRGWAKEPVAGPVLRPHVAAAGDLDALGFGRLLALRSADGLRLVVLADTGGAFDGNLHQLDLYTGVYPSRAAFDTATGKVGDTAEAWVVRVAEGCRESP